MAKQAHANPSPIPSRSSNLPSTKSLQSPRQSSGSHTPSLWLLLRPLRSMGRLMLVTSNRRHMLSSLYSEQLYFVTYLVSLISNSQTHSSVMIFLHIRKIKQNPIVKQLPIAISITPFFELRTGKNLKY